MTALHQGTCTCPACCPDKWALNRLSQQHLHGVLTQTGVPSTRPQDQAIAEILARLQRIEAIITAHIKATDS